MTRGGPGTRTTERGGPPAPSFGGGAIQVSGPPCEDHARTGEPRDGGGRGRASKTREKAGRVCLREIGGVCAGVVPSQNATALEKDKTVSLSAEERHCVSRTSAAAGARLDLEDFGGGKAAGRRWEINGGETNFGSRPMEPHGLKAWWRSGPGSLSPRGRAPGSGGLGWSHRARSVRVCDAHRLHRARLALRAIGEVRGFKRTL